MKRSYVYTLTLRRVDGNLRYVEEHKLGYRITNDVSVWHNPITDLWEVIYSNGMLMCQAKTRRDAVLIAYAFLPVDLATCVMHNTITGYYEWPDRDAKDRCMDTYRTLAEYEIRV